MKFPRSARIFRGHLDVAPFASVFFLLVIFVLLGTLIYTPGIPVELQLPEANNLPGTDRPTIAVAVDATGRFYFENQPVEAGALKISLEQAAKKSPEPLTLLVLGDKRMSYDDFVRLSELARAAGITSGILGTLPRIYTAPANKP